MEKPEIIELFYKKTTADTLFGEETKYIKENAINKSMELIKVKLKEIFRFVSDPFPMKNSKNSLMYHFIFATNNQSGFKIAKDIIGKELKEIKS